MLRRGFLAAITGALFGTRNRASALNLVGADPGWDRGACDIFTYKGMPAKAVPKIIGRARNSLGADLVYSESYPSLDAACTALKVDYVCAEPGQVWQLHYNTPPM